MFVNYFDSDTRSHPLNLAVGRILLGSYFVWRISSLDFHSLTEWPIVLNSVFTYLYPPSGFEFILVVEQWLVVGLGFALILGYHTKFCAFLTGIMASHLAGVIMVFYHSGKAQSITIAALLVILFGLYAGRDQLSIDGFRRTRQQSLSELNATLQGSIQSSYRMEPLKWALVMIGIIYFGAGVAKITTGPLLAWIQPENLARWTLYHYHFYQRELLAGSLLIESDILLTLSSASTVLAEVGLLFAVLAGVSVTLPIVLLLGMHTTVMFVMGILFFDSFFFLALFAAYDRGYARLVPDRDIDLVYDEHCYFCARSLYMFKYLDINETVSFYSQSSAPAQYQSRDEVEFDDEMYVFVDKRAYGGYAAFRELLRQFWFTTPIVWLMGFSLIERIGNRVYKYIAKNRNRYFVCSVERSG